MLDMLLTSPHTTAGLLISFPHTKINFPANQKGYDNSKTTIGKLLAREIQIFRVHFSVIIFDLLFLKQVKTRPEQKLTRQIWIRLVEYSSAEVSDLSEGPRIDVKLIFYLVKEVKLICVRLIILCLRVPVMF